MPVCKQCANGFEITEKDRQFYARMQVPEPALCSRCRQQKRLVWANQINLYKRKCDATSVDIISAYRPDSPLNVYCQSYWWSDKWDATQFGRKFDFNRPFFEQWAELARVVPRLSLHSNFQFDENSEYTNYAGYNKNCYMIFDSDYNWDCYYSMSSNKSKSCMDNNRIKESELCYECVDCVKCYHLLFSQDCDNCSNGSFLKNCIGCKNCFMCSNLKNKEYHIYNQPFEKEKFEKLMGSLTRYSDLLKYLKDWNAFKLKFPQKYMHGVQNENVVGDYLVYSKNAEYCFDSMELWDCKYFTRAFGPSKDCMDCDECGDKIELFYNSAHSGYNEQNVRCSHFCFSEGHDLDYCFYTHFSGHCFGCVGLVRKKYCILNKQYSREEYETLVPKIIEHMKKSGEWGEFFPGQMSDFAYNETVEQDYFPIAKEEALKAGYRWRDPDKKEYLPATAQVPDDSQAADKTICDALFACEICGRNYKIIEQELKLYKTLGVPVPKKCFYCRHKARFDLRNKRILYDRQCQNCGVGIRTTYEPDGPWTVFCEKCYLETLS